MDASSPSSRQVLDGDVDRRKEPRTQINVRGRLKSLDPLTSLGPSTVVQVVEISRHGFKVFVTRSYLPNSVVQLTMFPEIIIGKVRHCTPVDGGYHIGVERTTLRF